MKWIFRIFAGLALIVGLVVIAGVTLDTKVRPAPETAPGYRLTSTPAPHRDRDIPVHVWYPAEPDAEPPVLLAQNALFYGHYVHIDAPAATGPFPVVVLSHGSGGNAPQMGWLIREMVASGMIVVATNHPGTTSRDSDPFQTIRIRERPADLTALLDWTLGSDLPAESNRVGVLGFSLGGHSALALAGSRVTKAAFIDYCATHDGMPDCTWMLNAGVDFATIDQPLYEADHSDPRVRAAVAVDPALSLATTPDSLAAMDLPVLVINLGQDAPAAMRADALAATLPQGAYHVEPESWHFTFLAECSPLGRIVIGLASPDNICSDAGLRPRAEAHAALAARIVSFLSDTLQ